VVVPPVVPPGVVVVPPVVPPGVVVVPPVVPPGVVVSPVVPPVVPVPPVPPSLVPALQADNAKDIMAKLAAKALAQTVLDKSEVFILRVPFKVVNSCRVLTFKFKTS
jgi:hypothetical protein